MKVLQLLKKHYVATFLLFLGLLFAGYASYQLSETKPTDSTLKVIPTENSPAQNFDNQNSNNSVNDELKIPEIIKPTSTETELNIAPLAATSPENHPKNTDTPINQLSGTLIINGKNYTVNFTENSSVYEVMKQLHDQGQANIDFKNYSGLGYFVDGIDGVKSDMLRAKYWIYYINGAKAQIGISEYKLKSNDTITWKYENAE